MIKKRDIVIAAIFFLLGVGAVFLFDTQATSSSSSNLKHKSNNDMFKQPYVSKTVLLNKKKITLVESYDPYTDKSLPEDTKIYFGSNSDDYYSLSFDEENYPVRNENFEVYYFNSNGNANTKMLYTEWLWHAGGSAGEKAIIIWKYDDKLKPIAGFPIDLKDRNKINVKDKNGNIVASYSIMPTEWLAKYYDQKLYVAKFYWDTSIPEPHYGLHMVDLLKYSFEGDKFVIDKNWNNGKPLTPSKKYDNNDLNRAFYELLPIFENQKRG